MSGFMLTPAQQDAVTARNSAILVSAAAGSGKTRVLTERLMAYVTDKDAPKDIGSFLVITYTRAAASELRGRILEALSQRAAAEPENRRLRRQSTLCYQAQIGTIHSFCTTILREYCHKLDLTPDFRVGDEDRCAMLRDKALEAVMESAYEAIADDSDFAYLVESVGAGRDDSRLAQTVLELHGKMQSHPYPEKWMAQQLSVLDALDLTDVCETAWGAYLMKNAEDTARFWLDRLEKIWQSLSAASEENAALLSAYGDSLNGTTDALRLFLRALEKGWDSARNALPIPFDRLKPLKNYPFEDRKAAFLSAREACKDAMKNLCAVFDAPSDKLLRDLRETAPAMRALLKLTLAFDEKYAFEKRRQNLLDFSDLEHLAVALLCQAETGLPSETARELSRRYTEIMVDEYQDVSAVQELIFRCVSREESNIFMVGDVKQSIYRFRLADPTIFIEKYRRYTPFAQADAPAPRRISLQRNFRSDANILAACNHVFSNAMSPALGEISYDADAMLIPPEGACAPRGKTQLSILTVPQAEDGQERPDKTYLEALMVARQIRNLVESGETFMENGVLRAVQYGDVAILLRSPNSAGAAFRRALSDCGIPVLAEQGGDFFTAPEILIVTAFLSVIDNPHRDIPLTALLSSPVFGFTPDELSRIRVADRSGDFFTALEKSAETDPKCAAFLEALEKTRALSADIGIYELLCLIYDRYELMALFSGASGGERLLRLIDCAAAFEESGYRSLYDFLNQLKRMEARGEEPLSLKGASGNAVSILSIHKSKGLEFPVVFLANVSRKFNAMDLRAPVLVHPQLGLGCKKTDMARGIEYPTLARRAIAAKLSSELLSEEMRVLYVAMTRAKALLFISCAAKDPAALIAKLSENLSAPLSPELLKGAQSMSEWLISAALLENSGVMTLQVELPAGEAAFDAPPEEGLIPEVPAPDFAALEALESVLSFSYPYAFAALLPTKLTATALPDEAAEAEAPPVTPRARLFRQPDFLGEEKPLTGAERGTATHIVMQFIDFARAETPAGIESEIARIQALGQLSDRQAKAVDRQAILRFFASETGRRIRSADRVYRELRFSLLCPAELFFTDTDTGAEEIMLQGVVDCCIEEKGSLTVVDYKTDYVTEQTLPTLKAHYFKQLKAYAYAVSRVLEKPAEHCLLCFLQAGLTEELTFSAFGA